MKNLISLSKMSAALLVVSTLLASGASYAATNEPSLAQASPADVNQVVTGWSARKDIIGKNVVNEKNEKVGKIEDVIVAPDNHISYGVISAGGFLGVGTHDVAISVNYFHVKGDQIVLNGATKDILKKFPEFKYKK